MSARPLSEKSLKGALCTLARFHASTILTETRLGQTLDKVFRDSFTEKVFTESGLGNEWFIGSIDIAVAMAEKLEIKNTKEIAKIMNRIYNALKPSKIHRNVICHGDLWANNIMFENGNSDNCLLVDFQIVRYAPLVLDLLQLIYLNTDEKISDKMENNLLKVYQKTLNEVITKNKSIQAKAPTFEEIAAAYQEFKYFGIIMAILYLPAVLLGPDILTEMTSGEKGFEEFFVENRRKNIILDYMETNEKFKEHMKLLVENILTLL